MEIVLKGFLRPNELTSDPNDMTAVVSSQGSIDQDGLIDALMDEGIELKRETLKDVITRYIRIGNKYAISGWNVDTGQVYMRLTIGGTFTSTKFDPEKNSVNISVTPGVGLRKDVANVKVEILGLKADMMYILQVVNTKTKAADGTLTRGRNAVIEGACLKIAGEEDAPVGVYFINLETKAETKLDDDLIVTNDPSKLLILVPDDLPAGVYRLKVVTQYTKGSVLLKAPREAVCNQELTVA